MASEYFYCAYNDDDLSSDDLDEEGEGEKINEGIEEESEEELPEEEEAPEEEEET